MTPSFVWPPEGGGGSGGGVTSLNTLTGDVILAAGTGITLTPVGQTITIASTSQPAGNYITALTGDGTASGPGSAALTLAAVNSNVGSFTHSSITVNAKGLITAASSGTVGNLTDAGTDGIVVTGGTGAVIGSGTSIAQHVADTTHNGYLSSTDWNTFNGKQSSLTIGNLTDAGTDGIIITGGTGAVIGSGTSIAQTKADATHNGYLSSSDWTAFSSTANPMTTLGDIIYENATPAPARLPGNITSTKNFLTQTGTGSVSAAPAWGTIVSGDLPADVAYVDVNNTFTAFQTSSYAGIASHGALTLTGSPFTGGSATTTKPQLLLEDAVTSGGFSTSGTYLGINCKTGFSGNAFQVSQNGTNGMTIGPTGTVTTPNCTATEVIVGATGILGPNNATLLIGTGRSFSSANSVHQIIDNGQADTASSGTSVSVAIKPTWNQTSTANATDLLINRTETAAPNTQLFFSCQVSGSTKYAIDHTGLVTTGTWGGTSFAGNSAILKSPTFQSLTSTGSTAGYLFVVSSANATAGATYTNNGQTFTVLSTISGAILLAATATGAPTASGTLTKATGTGDSTITFSSTTACATYAAPSGPAPLYVKFTLSGGGGGGGGSGSGSPGTGTTGTKSVFATSLGTVSCGGGAQSGGAGNNGGAGGTVVTVGSGFNQIFSYPGNQGGGGSTLSATGDSVQGGAGGSNKLGGYGNSGADITAGGNAPANSGGGGGGAGGGTASASASATGPGGGSGAYYEFTVNAPTGTILYAVGAGGTGGAAGTNGAAGGNGAAGILVAEEHYQ